MIEHVYMDVLNSLYIYHRIIHNCTKIVNAIDSSNVNF